MKKIQDMMKSIDSAIEGATDQETIKSLSMLKALAQEVEKEEKEHEEEHMNLLKDYKEVVIYGASKPQPQEITPPKPDTDLQPKSFDELFNGAKNKILKQGA